MLDRQTRRTFIKNAAFSSAALYASSAQGALGASSDWAFNGGSAGSTRYSELDQIDRSNVAELKVAWTHHTGDAMQRPATRIECTPIVVDGRMYITTAQLQVRALDAATGEQLWNFDPFEGIRMRSSKGVNRGVMYWADGDDRRIFASAREFLYCLNADSGELVSEFADDGILDMKADLDRDLDESVSYYYANPPVVFEDILLLGGGSGSEGPAPAAPGHIRGFDIRTGKRLWIFHTIPHPGEFGYETWGKDNWKHVGGTNNWGGMSVDEERGLLFASTGSPTFDFYGADRPGKNLFANSVIALDARTGERKWHFQAIPSRSVGLRFSGPASARARQAQRGMARHGCPNVEAGFLVRFRPRNGQADLGYRRACRARVRRARRTRLPDAAVPDQTAAVLAPGLLSRRDHKHFKGVARLYREPAQRPTIRRALHAAEQTRDRILSGYDGWHDLGRL